MTVQRHCRASSASRVVLRPVPRCSQNDSPCRALFPRLKANNCDGLYRRLSVFALRHWRVPCRRTYYRFDAVLIPPGCYRAAKWRSRVRGRVDKTAENQRRAMREAGLSPLRSHLPLRHTTSSRQPVPTVPTVAMTPDESSLRRRHDRAFCVFRRAGAHVMRAQGEQPPGRRQRRRQAAPARFKYAAF